MTDVAVVTGAGRGLGALVAERIARRGHAVVVTDIDTSAAERTAKSIGEQAVALHHDVRDPDQHTAAAELAASLGTVKVWVNNAGLLRTGALWDQPDDVMRMTVEVNLLGVVHGTRAALTVMRQHGTAADIVNMGSMSAYGPLPGLAVYAATKAAVVSWTLSTAAELRAANSPVRMHVMCPDGVQTDMVAENAGDAGSAMIFSGKLLEPAAVADELVALVGSNRLVRSVPRNRAALARLTGLVPRQSLPLVDQVAKLGERNRRKAVNGQ